MAFDSLTDKLQNVFRKLRSKGTITEADVQRFLKEWLRQRKVISYIENDSSF